MSKYYYNKSNKSIGNDFESEFCKLLSNNGFWAHKMQDNHNGQPADVIASINGTPVLIDCKSCEQGTFKLSRVEDNQYNAMTKWLRCGNEHAYFAFKVNEDILLTSFQTINYYRDIGVKTLDMMDFLNGIVEFTDWLEMIKCGR